MSAIGLAAEATIAEAEAALAIWRDVPVQKKDFEELSRRISRMEEDMAAFAADVARLVAATAPDIDCDAPLTAVDAIVARLDTARMARSRRDALTESIDKREVERASLMTQKARIDKEFWTTPNSRSVSRLSRPWPRRWLGSSGGKPW